MEVVEVLFPLFQVFGFLDFRVFKDSRLSEWRVYDTILITWRYFGGLCFGSEQFLQCVPLHSVTNTRKLQNYIQETVVFAPNFRFG